MPVRRAVLERLLQDHRALGADTILDHLRDMGFGGHPPIVYRALDFLVEHGFAHWIERLDAFVASAHLGIIHAPAFMICRRCNAVAETYATNTGAGLSTAAKVAGLRIKRTVIEAEGIRLSYAQKSGP